ncbi:50S ribosomal protein L25, partial [Clarias magur]
PVRLQGAECVRDVQGNLIKLHCTPSSVPEMSHGAEEAQSLTGFTQLQGHSFHHSVLLLPTGLWKEIKSAGSCY